MTRLGPVFIARPRARNTQDSCRCRECNGAGCTELQVGLCDFEVTYCAACEDGWCRWRETDPLIQMRYLRSLMGRSANLFRKYQEMRQRALGANHER